MILSGRTTGNIEKDCLNSPERNNGPEFIIIKIATPTTDTRATYMYHSNIALPKVMAHLFASVDRHDFNCQQEC